MFNAAPRGVTFILLAFAFALCSCSSREVVLENVGPTAQERAKMSPKEQIFDAAKRGDIKTLEKLLAADPTLVNAKDNQGQTPLHYTALCVNPDVVNFLVKKGANPLARDLEERTPAYYASEMRSKPAVSKALGDAANAAAEKRSKPKAENSETLK